MWKAEESRKNKVKKTKLALFVLGLIILLIIFAQLARLSKTLFSPWNLTSQRQHTWNGKFNINLIIKSEQVHLVLYNPKEQKITIIKVPDETYLDVPRGFGKWQLRSIYNLGGYRLLEQSLTDFFGSPVDGFMETNQLEELLQKNPFSTLNLLSSLKTDLNLWELLRLKMGLSEVRFDKIRELNLESLNVGEKINLLDGSEVFVADSSKLDSVLSDFADPNFTQEGKTIAIFNATDHPQLAQKATRLISNLGGHVIIVSNAKIKLKTTVLLGEKSATLERLQQIFGSSGTINPKDGDFESSRAEINLFLGEDYFNLN